MSTTPKEPEDPLARLRKLLQDTGRAAYDHVREVLDDVTEPPTRANQSGGLNANELRTMLSRFVDAALGTWSPTDDARGQFDQALERLFTLDRRDADNEVKIDELEAELSAALGSEATFRDAVADLQTRLRTERLANQEKERAIERARTIISDKQSTIRDLRVTVDQLQTEAQPTYLTYLPDDAALLAWRAATGNADDDPPDWAISRLELLLDSWETVRPDSPLAVAARRPRAFVRDGESVSTEPIPALLPHDWPGHVRDVLDRINMLEVGWRPKAITAALKLVDGWVADASSPDAARHTGSPSD
jgi:hypothetical protein